MISSSPRTRHLGRLSFGSMSSETTGRQEGSVSSALLCAQSRC